MTLLWLILVVLWTLLVLRIVGARATLGESTFATYLVLGALLAIAAAPPLASLVNPYNQQPSGFALLLLTMGRLALLLAPVGYALLSRGTERAISVIDAFLLAFMVGFGFDLLGAIVTASASSQPLRAPSFLPPWEIKAEQRMVVAGFGYWAGLVALTYAASRRFIRRPRIVGAITLVVFLLVSLQAAALATVLRPTGPLGFVLSVTLDGAATAWIALVALVALSVGESFWVARLAPGGADSAPGFLAEWQARLLALVRGQPREYARLSGQYGRQRQAQLERAEAASSGRQAFRPSTSLPPRPPLLPPPSQPPPSSGYPTPPASPPPPAPLPSLPSSGQAGQAGQATPVTLPRLHDDERPTPRPTPPPISGGALDRPDTLIVAPERSRFWRHVGATQIALVALLAVVVVLLPNLPVTVSRAIWAFPLLSFELKQPPLTIVNTGLVLMLLWWYVVAAGRPSSSVPDDIVRFASERTILHATLAAVVLVVLDVRNNFLYPFYSVAAIHTRASFPQLEPFQAQTLLLLLAAAAAGLTLNRAGAWRWAPLSERRSSAVRQAISVVLVLLLSWIVVVVYLPTLALFHQLFGTLLFALFGQGGNVIGGYVMIVFSGLLSWLTLWVLRPMAERVERFLVDDRSNDLTPSGRSERRPDRREEAEPATADVGGGSPVVRP